MPSPSSEISPARLEPEWFWDGSTDRPRRGGEVALVTRGPGSSPLKLPGRLVTPGFTNFHCHLELSAVARPPAPEPGTFVSWLGHVIRHGPADGAAAAGSAAVAGARASLAFGVTHVVDITRFPRETREALTSTPLRVTSCGEITGLARRVGQGQAMLDAALVPLGLAGAAHITPGLSPHAPYSTDARWYAAAADAARRMGLTLTTHLCETPDERTFLADHTGTFRDLWSRLGDWTDDVQRFPTGPVHWLDHHNFFTGTHALLAHCNDLTDEELRLLAARDATVVHCPRTHAYFSRQKFDLGRYRDAGVTVKLGTDSAASSGDLDLLADLRLFARQNPELTPAEVLSMALPSYAQTPTDFCVWPVSTDDPLRELLSRDDLTPEQVWIAGRRVV